MSVESALMARLAELSHPIAWPNVEFTPTHDLYLQVQFFSTGSERLTIAPDSWHRVSGFMQVSIMAPHGDGIFVAAGVADEIKAKFTADLVLPTTGTPACRVTQRPIVAGGLADGAFWMVPVTIRYEALT